MWVTVIGPDTSLQAIDLIATTFRFFSIIISHRTRSDGSWVMAVCERRPNLGSCLLTRRFHGYRRAGFRTAMVFSTWIGNLDAQMLLIFLSECASLSVCLCLPVSVSLEDRCCAKRLSLLRTRIYGLARYMVYTLLMLRVVFVRNENLSWRKLSRRQALLSSVVQIAFHCSHPLSCDVWQYEGFGESVVPC